VDDKRVHHCSKCKFVLAEKQKEELRQCSKQRYKEIVVPSKQKRQCETCGEDITSSGQKRFCSNCSKKRRKEKMQQYMIDRRNDPIRKQRQQVLGNIARQNKREERRKAGLCTECGEPIERNISLCSTCNDKRLKISINHNRKVGMKPAGQSQFQRKAFEFLNSFCFSKVYYNNRKTIHNPKTGKPLELDIFIPELDLAFEIDGPMHQSPVYGQSRYLAQLENDRTKNELCLQKGITLIRISTQQVQDDEFLRTILSEAVRKAQVGQTAQRIDGEEPNQ
jgi:hypothetical protein